MLGSSFTNFIYTAYSFYSSSSINCSLQKSSKDHSLFVQCYYRVPEKTCAVWYHGQCFYDSWSNRSTLLTLEQREIKIQQLHIAERMSHAPNTVPLTLYTQLHFRIYSLKSTLSSFSDLTNITFLISASGWYLFIGPRGSNDKARLISPSTTETKSCLLFFYHMYGADVNELRVFIFYLFLFLFINFPKHKHPLLE